jgi:signal peptidase I
MRSNALAEWVFNFIVLIFATTSIAQPFVIPSGSMESTLMTGDHVLVDKLAYAPADALTRHLLPYEPIQRGDIVVFRYPVDERQTFVKRVIALPGDRVRLENKEVWRNGLKLQEKYVQHIFPPNEYRDNFPAGVPLPGEIFAPAERMLATCVTNGELIVPPGNYFVMGDNRDNSSDSRYWGFVPAKNIVGKPVLVWWSYEASGGELTDFVNVRHVLDMAAHFFTKTRWDRTMHVVHSAS